MAIGHSEAKNADKGDKIVVRRAGSFSSEDIHRALFAVPPQSHGIGELKEGIRRYIRKRHPRR
jgi:hypothetical protein